MVDVGNAIFGQPLKEDLVLPEGVVGVKMQSARFGHQLSRGSGTAVPCRLSITSTGQGDA